MSADERRRRIIAHYEENLALYTGIYARQAASGDIYPANEVRLEVVLRCLERRKAVSVLDAGCGTGEPMAEFLRLGYDAWGFDFSPGTLDAARRHLASLGLDAGRLLPADAERFETFPPQWRGAFDAVVGKGLMPHELDDAAVYANVRALLKPGGAFLAEYRNALMSLFSINRHCARFYWDELLPVAALTPGMRDETRDFLAAKFDMDPAAVTSPAAASGVLPRFHNPLTLGDELAAHGLRLRKCHFYHYHCAPPHLEGRFPDDFRRTSRAMEHSDDWRGMFLCSAFIAEIERPEEGAP